jgi:phosphopantothenoylcysteine synthetase/decarboxylase
MEKFITEILINNINRYVSFKRQKVLLGVSGGLPHTKTATLDFYKAGAHVQVIMTPASKVLTPLTLSTLYKILFILLVL